MLMNFKSKNVDASNSDAHFTELSNEQLERAKSAFSTRNVDLSKARYLLSGEVRPEPGDLLLARIKQIGQHARIELANGRRSHLFQDDEVILCYGNRYAPDQFEGLVPDDLDDCHMVASGGVAAQMSRKHTKVKNATSIAPIGILADAHKQRMNLKHANITEVSSESSHATVRPLVLGIVGTAMNAGKTHMAAAAIYGMKRAGLKVASLKLTGTASGVDLWKMLDAGAWPVYDFTDAGFTSTYLCSDNEIDTIIKRLISKAVASNPDVIVVELADGIFQRETSALLRREALTNHVDGFLFAAADSSGVMTGIQTFEKLGIKLIGVGGQLTASPLLTEEVEAHTSIPVYRTSDLHSVHFMRDLKRCKSGDFVKQVISA